MESDSKDRAEIEFGLSEIRFVRTISHVPLLALIVVALAEFALRSLLPEIGESVWRSSAFQIVWLLLWLVAIISFLMGFTITSLKCPACGNQFHVRRNGRSFVYNSFCRSCLNCGLPLNGPRKSAP
jgi:hypothetical protein